jgi:beta-lactamase regulating signal transducer with metallopeptidase domain
MPTLPATLANAQHLAPAAASALIAALWQSAALVALVALALHLLPRLSPAIRSLIWTAVLVLAVALPFIPATHATSRLATASHPALRLAEGWSLLLATAWLTLSAVRLAQLAHSAWHLSGIVRRATEVDRNTLAPEAAALLTSGWRRARLCVSTEVDRPSVAGFVSPRILLPAGLLHRVSPLELEQILLHEREHLLRADDWINLAQKLALALFPLNPALFFLDRRLATERELACDDNVIRVTSAPKAYALCLTSLAEMSLARRTALLALAAWQRRPELSRRVERILFQPMQTMGRRPATLSGIAVTALAAAFATTLAHAPALVRFAPPATQLTDLAAPVSTIAIAPRIAATPVALTFTSANPRTLRARSTNLVFHLPAAPARLRLASQAARAAQPHPFRAIATTSPAPRHTTPAMHEISALADSQPQPTTYRQLVATGQDATGTWTMVARWEVNTPRPAPSITSDAEPAGNAYRTNDRATPRRNALPTYAAIATPNGWLVLEL